MKTMRSLRGMTVIIAAVILITTIFAIPVPSANAAGTMPRQPQTYTKPGTIWSEIDGEFTALDERGQLWAFDADPDSFIVGQEVELVMSDAGTPEYIYDDEVVAVNPIQSSYANVAVGPLGRYILKGTVFGIYNQSECVWFSDQYGEDWFFYGFCPLQRGESATLVINSNGTPDFSDDFVEDVLWSDCTKAD